MFFMPYAFKESHMYFISSSVVLVYI